MNDSKPQDTKAKYDLDAIELHDPPADVKSAERTGYAVYDRVLGSFVGPVHRDGKPTDAEAQALAGHESVAIVAV